MSVQLNNLYREVIMFHSSNPYNKGLEKKPEAKYLKLVNSSCGDIAEIEVMVKDSKITSVRHLSKGCSISCAAASVLCKTIENTEIKDAKEIISTYFKIVKGEEVSPDFTKSELIAFSGVKAFPARVRCATLAWKALEEILNALWKKEKLKIKKFLIT